MADNVSVARGQYDDWNERDFDRLADAFAADSEIVLMGSGNTFRGPDGARQYNESWADGFPDGRVTVDNIVSSGDVVVVEFTGRGTHTGTLVSSAGSIPATDRSVTLKLCDILEFADGKIRRQRTYFDTGSLMAQLGLAAQQTTTTCQ